MTKRGARFNWTEQRTAEAVRPWLGGAMATEISRAFDGAVSRNAVIGKLTRLGHDGRRGHIAPVQARAVPAIPTLAVKPINRRAINPNNIARKAAGRAHDPVGPAVSVRDESFTCDFVEPPNEGSITIADLSERTCRWPFGDTGNLEDFRYCGAAKSPTGGPYCAGHARLAVDPALTRKRRSANA